MKYSILVFSTLIFSGCQTMPRVYQYRGFDKFGDLTIIFQSESDTSSTCKKLGSTKEDRTGNKQDIFPACYDYANGIIWTSHRDYLRHELCHRANPPVWDGKDWKYLNDCWDVE